jgi:hypothetical protein
MQKSVLGLLVLVVLVVLGSAFWFVGSTASESTDARPEVAAAAAPASPEAAAELVEPESRPAEPEPAREAKPEPIAAAPSEAMDEDERQDAAVTAMVSGSVTLPDGTPADERVEILAFVGSHPGAWEHTGADPDSVVDRAELAEDGSFEIGFPDDASSGWLLLTGRYSYGADPLEVQLPADDPVSFAPKLGAWVSGKLLPPADATDEELEEVGEGIRLQPDPMASMGMMAFDNQGPSRRRTSANEDLAFEFGGVVPAAKYELRARPELLAAVQSEPFTPAPGEHIALDLTLVRGGSIAGYVIDGAGDPVGDAKIEIEQDPLMFGQGGFEVREGEVNEDGTFELIAVAPGKCSVKVEGNGFLDTKKEVELAEGQRITGFELVVDVGSTIAGTVVWPDQSPVAGVEVDVSFDPSYLGGMEAFNAMRGASGESDTADDGRFVVAGLGKGPFVVTVEADGEDAPGGGIDKPGEWKARISDVRPDGDDLTLVLEPPLGLAGRVVDDLGEPITSFKVLARAQTGGGMMAGLGAETQSDEFEDENGEFFLEGLRAGEWDLFAGAEGYGRPDGTPVVLPLEDGAVVELTLERGGIVNGRVLDPLGAPVAGAEVGLERTLADLGRIASEEGEPPTAKTDENGEFSLTGMSPGSLNLIAKAEGFADSVAVGVELTPAEVLEDILVTLRVGGRLTGELFNDEGKPHPGQTVMAQVPTNPTGQRWATTDGEGRFVIENLIPDTWQVMTFPTGGSDDEVDTDNLAAMFKDMKFTMAEIRDGEDTHVLLGAPPKNPVEVHGRLVAGGKPVPNTMVQFFADGEGGLDAMKFANSDANGEFEVQLSQPGRYVLNVQKMVGTGQQETCEFSEEIPEAEEHDLVVQLPIGGISGLVKGPDGSPLRGVRISLGVDGPIANGSFTGGNYAEVTTDEEGRYQLQWLREGTYSVSAGGAFLGGFFGDTGDKTFGRQVRNGLKISDGEWMKNVDFRLKEPGSIKGRVTSGGQPVPEAALFVRDASGNPIDRLSMIQSDASGKFEYLSLEPGDYTIIARTKEEVTSQSLPVRVREGESTEIEVTVDQGCILLVGISDKEGNPVRCSIEITDPDGNQINGLWSLSDLMEAFGSGTFSSDEQRIGPVAPGKYRIKATAPDGRKANKPVTVRSQTERKVNLRLD